MIDFIIYTIRRWWWSKWHPFVRVGWTATRANTSGSPVQAYFGIGMIVAGLILRSRKALHLYSGTIPAGEEVRIKVVQNGRTIGTG